MTIHRLPDEKLSEEEVRLRHLGNFRSKGLEPYPARAERSGTLAELKNLPMDSAATAAGRIVSKRLMGKLCFCHLKDFSGKLQIVFSEQELGKERYNFFTENFDLGDFLEVKGKIFTTHRGEISVLAGDFGLLSKALLPLPDKFHGLNDVEQRYRKRYLDLISSEESLSIAKTRSRLIRELRNYFDERGFFEVETPILQTLYGGALAKPFVTHHNALDIPLYLRIAPELYLKRLIVGGFEKVYEVGKCFRNEGVDHDHNPEFTMIEFYWAFADYRILMELTEDLLPKLIRSLGLPLKFSLQGEEIDFTPPYPRISMRDLIIKFAGVDIEDFPDQAALLAEAERLGVEGVDKGSDRGKIIDDIYKKFARPHILNPIFMIDHPVELSPLAKKKSDDPRYVERFQLLCAGGNELCNAFSELNDPIDQEERFREQAENRKAGNEESMPFDKDFVTALKQGMPPTAGFGMGIDRLVKLLVNAPNLKEVILFPTLKPERQAPLDEAAKDGAALTPLPLDRKGAFELLKKYNKNEASFNHYLESEAVMRALAKRLGRNEEWWGMAGLLHDIDWDLTKDEPAKHLTLAPEFLRSAGFPEDFIQVVLSHGYGCDCAGLINEHRTKEIEFALAAGETVTGLVHAAALMRSDKIATLTADSLIKKFKSKGFAAKVNREVIKECEKLGIPLLEFLELSIGAIKGIAPSVGLA